MKNLIRMFCIATLAVMTAIPLAAQDVAPRPAQDAEILVPAGTVFPVILNTYLNTKGTQVGDVFYADTAYPIWIQQRLVIPRGSIIRGVVTQVNKPGKIKGKGSIAIKFQSILLPNGVQKDLIANFHGIHGPGAEKIDRQTESVEPGSTTNKGEAAGTIVGTAAEGAIIGTIASRGAMGAGIGAGAGALTGIAIVLLGRNRDLLLEPGIQFDLELAQALQFAYGEIVFSEEELRQPVRTATGRQNRPPKGRNTMRFPGIGLPRIIR